MLLLILSEIHGIFEKQNTRIMLINNEQSGEKRRYGRNVAHLLFYLRFKLGFFLFLFEKQTNKNKKTLSKFSYSFTGSRKTENAKTLNPTK